MYDPTKPYIREIQKIIKKTWKGEFPFFIASADGIGTKGRYHWKNKLLEEAALDALAMNLNDLLMGRHRPLHLGLTNRIILPEDDHDAFVKIVGFLADECVKHRRGVQIIGGECSVNENGKGMEISISIFGLDERNERNKRRRLDNRCQIGDVLVGIPSNGMHANGHTFLRKIFEDKFFYIGSDFLKDFLAPTRMYFDELQHLANKSRIHMLQHITGGAFTKLKERLCDKNTGEYGMDAVINGLRGKPETHERFFDIYEDYVSDKEMYSIFNCGIGFIISFNPKDVEFEYLCLPGDAYVIGKVTEGSGKIKIKSQFSDREVVL